MNWGKGIVTGMVIFMLFILSMCVYMFTMPADEYDHQYYEKGLGFNKDYNREQQVATDHAQPIIKLDGRTLQIKFVAPASGTVRFVRPSSQSMDVSFPINTGAGIDVSIPVSSLKTGQWQMVFEWNSNNKEYLYQQENYIP